MTTTKSFLGYHMQDPFPEWNGMLAMAAQGHPFRAIKIFHPEDYAAVKAASWATRVVYRPYADKQNQGHYIDQAATGRAGALAAADEYIDTWIDSVRQHMPDGYIESINEEYPTGNPAKLAGILAFDQAFVQRLADRLPNHRAVVFTAAVGNPGYEDLEQLVGLGHLVEYYAGAFGYHAYWPVKQGQSGVDLSSAWQNLHGRWTIIDAYLLNRGVSVDWFLGEVGPIGCDFLDPPPGGNWNLHPTEGWKSSDVWGGSIDDYIIDLAGFDRLLAGTQAAKDGRLLGSAIFTSRPGEDPSWYLFNTVNDAAWRVAELVQRGVVVDDPDPEPPPEPPPPEPPPPPPPDPDPEVPYVVVVNLLPQDATLAEKQIVLERTHASKETILQSADDAARLVAPGQPGSKVKVWNAERWSASIHDWLTEHGVNEVEFNRFETVWPKV